MSRPQLTEDSGRDSLEAFRYRGTRRSARGPRARSTSASFGALLAAAIHLFALGCAEELEEEPAATVETQPENRTARQTPDVRTIRQRPPRQSPPVDGKEFRLQRKRDWWNNTRETLFTDIDLSAEQVSAVDAILETQLDARARMQELDSQYTAARRTQNRQRIAEAREKIRAFKDQLKEPHEIYEAMRAVLTEEQRPTFDMNRARHVAAMQGSGRTRAE